MELMQMAGHLSLETGAEVEGPYGDESRRTVTLWLPNRRGIALTWCEGRDAPGTGEMAVIREVVPEGDVSPYGTPWRLDYSTSITDDTVPGTDLIGARDALRTLRGLSEIDPRDLRTTRRAGGREQEAKHYGASRTACGAAVETDDMCTETIKDVRCPDCLEAINRSV